MPTENPPRRAIFAEIETALHALNLYGAAGITALGWAMGRFLGADSAPWLPLWFCAALLIYNADRLRTDPADALNIPERAAACARWRPAIRGLVILSALVLIGLPVWRRDWLTLKLVIGGSIVTLGYSLPPRGWRWKDVPLVKTLFAPTVITAAIFGLLFSETDRTYNAALHTNNSSHLVFEITGFLLLAPWAWCYLLFNMLLCDLRDRAGDAQCGIRSIPVLWGEKGARRMLWTLACAAQIFLAVHLRFHDYAAACGAVLSFLTGLYQAWLLHATRQPRGERFYEWAVEGLLFLPALAWGLGWLLYRYVLTDI